MEYCQCGRVAESGTLRMFGQRLCSSCLNGINWYRKKLHLARVKKAIMRKRISEGD